MYIYIAYTYNVRAACLHVFNDFNHSLRISFSMPTAPDQGSSEDADIDRAMEIQKKFTVMLRNYIHGNALKQTILQQMTEILVCALLCSVSIMWAEPVLYIRCMTYSICEIKNFVLHRLTPSYTSYMLVAHIILSCNTYFLFRMQSLMRGTSSNSSF